MLVDLRTALRQLAQSPGFAAVAILTLALGIGATTAIFSVVNGVLLQPLPYVQPEQLISVWESSRTQNFPKAPLPPGHFYDLRAQNRTFAGLAAWTPNALNLAGEGLEAERLEGAAVTMDFQPVLRVEPVRGRFFGPDEFAPGKDGLVVLSHAVWQQRFAGDAAIIGRTIQLNGRARTVVGVMPDGFNYPAKTQAWIPYAPDAEFAQRRDWHLLRAIGRLKEGVAASQAQEDLRALGRQFATAHPDTDADWGIDVYPMLEDAVSKIRQPLVVLLAAVGALLLIACANVANLLLSRAAGRRREIAVRISLGATRGRIIRQLLLENLVLFVIGATAGLLVAQWGLSALLAVAPVGIPRIDQVGIDRLALLFTSGVALATGLVFGLIPAWQGSQTNLTAALRTGDRGATGGRALLRPLLVVLQVSAAVMLLAVAGLLIRSFDQVRRVNPGFNPERVLTFRVDLPAQQYNAVEKTSAFINAIVDQLATLPGVESAGATTAVPLAAGPVYIMRFEGRPPVTPSNSPVAAQRVVTRDYFATMGISLVRGRLFDGSDAPGGRRVCVINQALARKFFPHEDPIGKRLEIGFDDPPAWREIVGVVADSKSNGLESESPVQVFEPTHQWQVNSYSVVVRSTRDPVALVPLVRDALRRLDPSQPLHTIKPMTQLVTESLAQRYFSLVLLVVFAAVALSLAIVGLYGVVAYNVAQRTREFGVRLALGATAGNVLALVLRQGVMLVGVGVVLGLAGAFAAAGLVESLLYGVGAHDPLTFVAIAVLLGAVAILACLVPALRATRVDPVIALRAE